MTFKDFARAHDFVTTIKVNLHRLVKFLTKQISR